MKKNKGIFMLTMWWFVIPAVIGLVVLCFSPDKERVSFQENRVLQNRPSFSFAGLTSGEYTSQFETFLSDSMPCRNLLIKASDWILERFSMNTSYDMYYLDTTEKDVENFFKENGSDSDEENPTDDEQTGTAVDADVSEEMEEGDACLKFIKHDGGEWVKTVYTRQSMKNAAASLEKCAELLPDDGKVYFTTMSFPSTANILGQHLDVYKGWESTLPEKMNQLTSDKVVCVDSYEILQPHMLNGEDVFLHTNHQWNDVGAYYVFSSIIESQGLTPTPFDEYDYDVCRAAYSGKISGYDEFHLLYPLAPSANWEVTNVNHRTKVPFMNYHIANTLSYFDGHHLPWRTVESGFHTGRNALVVGDCFSLAFAPFLLPYYDEVHATRLKSDYFDRTKLGTTVADMIARNHITDFYYISSESSGVNTWTLQHTVAVNLY